MSRSGYSGTPLFKKLGYKPGFKVMVVNEPDNYKDLLLEIPEGVVFGGEGGEPLDMIHFFTLERIELELELPKLKEKISKEGMIWVSWPKKSSKVETDVDEHAVRSTGLLTGLVDIKICAVDEIWSGLKFVYRKKDR